MKRAAALALLLAASTSRADETIDSCIDAHRHGQELARSAQLVEARKAFEACLRAECPDVVRDQCTRLALDTERATPSVVIVVRDARGRDRVDVPVTLDGRDLGPSERGTAVTLNPGRHVARAMPKAGPPVEEAFVAHESEKGRLVAIVLAAPKPKPAPEPPREDAGVSGRAALGIALLTTGAAALTAAAALWVAAYVRYGDLEEECLGRCAEEDVDAARGLAIAGDVLAPVGAVALGVGAYLTATAPDATSVGLVLSGRF
ncbi:MAG TPA: hypothetical protein VFB62_26605 [Polyangiaceae bacterium]|jgi:hypothetical protein|nr:hypothetical protein [Polyangiaceae bacterium]